MEIPVEIYQNILALTQEAPEEISGFGRTSIEEGRSGAVVKVETLRVFPQDCNMAHTSLKNEDLHKLYYEVAKMDEDPSKWNFWWHSHVDMPTGFSSTDDATMKRLTAKRSGSDVGGLIIAICTNKNKEYSTTMYKDGRRLMENLPFTVPINLPESVLATARQNIKENVKSIREFDYHKVFATGAVTKLEDLDIDKHTEGMGKKKKKRFLAGIREFFQDGFEYDEII